MEELKKIFNEELKNYQELLKISKNKTDMIKENRVKDLEAVTKEEEELVASVISLEKRRMAEVKNICKQYGRPEENLKVDELCEFVTEGKEDLISFKTDITNILTELKSVNKLNESLINNSLEYINFALSFATGVDPNGGTYGESGQRNEKGPNNILDIKL
ncbi:MAG: flagellar protein FlgN, partial [Clostridia bacterium]|nr:flagellar protein FlgN [Clostridia bacterium]